MTDAISYEKSLINITEEEYSIMMLSRKLLLFQNSEPLVKKDCNKDFDVHMEWFDGAEICELVGSFIPNQLGSVIDKNDIGLYRDDSLGNFWGISKSMIERKKKLIVRTFKQGGLAITIECNFKTVNFLDITFALQNHAVRPMASLLI